MIASGSLPAGGIWVSPSYLSALISKLSAGRPGTTAGPLSPPLRSPSRLSSNSPPLSFLIFAASAEWHFRQCSARAGRIFFSKKSVPGSAAAGRANRPATAAAGSKRGRFKPQPRVGNGRAGGPHGPGVGVHGHLDGSPTGRPAGPGGPGRRDRGGWQRLGDRRRGRVGRRPRQNRP